MKAILVLLTILTVSDCFAQEDTDALPKIEITEKYLLDATINYFGIKYDNGMSPYDGITLIAGKNNKEKNIFEWTASFYEINPNKNVKEIFVYCYIDLVTNNFEGEKVEKDKLPNID